jgi:hypothetical protein
VFESADIEYSRLEMEDTRAPAEVASSAAIEVAGGREEVAATPPPRFMREDEVAQNPPVALASYPRSGFRSLPFA